MAGFDWGALIGAAVSAYGANSAKKSTNAGTAASVAGSQAAIDEQRRQFDLSRGDQAPWLQAGAGALGQMQALNSGDFSSFHNSPDYQFAVDQGMKTLDRSAASRGRMNSGGYGQDLVKYGQGMADQNYGNYYTRLQDMAGQGHSAATNLGSLGQSFANNVGSQYNNMGQARQSGYQQNGYNNAAMWSNIGSGLNQWYQGRQRNTPYSSFGSGTYSSDNYGPN